jgi:hypothetical protein
MSRWGTSDYSNNTSKQYALDTFNKGNNAIANGSALYHNTTPSAFTNGMVQGLYGVTNTMVQAAQANHATLLSQPGWTLVRQGTGPVLTITASPGGTSYNNTDVLTISGNGCVNCTSNPVTNSTGGILSFTNIVPGFGFPNTAYVTKAFANSTGGASSGSGATVVITLGGRAGRINREVLVATGSMINGNASSLFPTS